jgi:hypothetical protein
MGGRAGRETETGTGMRRRERLIEIGLGAAPFKRTGPSCPLEHLPRLSMGINIHDPLVQIKGTHLSIRLFSQCPISPSS